MARWKPAGGAGRSAGQRAASVARVNSVASQRAGEVPDDLAGVVFDAADERGLAPPEHGQPERVQARAADNAALVAQLALRVEHGHVEPPVVRPKAGRPHDRADLPPGEVKLPPR